MLVLCDIPILQRMSIKLSQQSDMTETESRKSNKKTKIDIFLNILLKTDCGYTLESPRQGSSNEYPQSMFWSKNKKNRYTPAYPSFVMKKWGSRGYTLHGHVFLMEIVYSFYSMLRYFFRSPYGLSCWWEVKPQIYQPKYFLISTLLI